MKGLTSILGFDDVYQAQSCFRRTDYEWIDLSDVKNANRYCEIQSLEVIGERLRKRSNKGITFIGSGNYHYVTYLLLSEVKSPFTLVLFDYHTDMMPPPCQSVISCGSWVLTSIERLPSLKKVVVIGAKSDLDVTIPKHFNKKVSVFPNDSTYREDRVKNAIIFAIPTVNVYVSIDKDVLDKSEAATDWDQGNMTLAQLLRLIEHIALHKRIFGIDVCGEYPVPPADRFCRESLLATRINEQANRKILDSAMKVKTLKKLAM
ncbi:MAG: arginase family protein [Clostridiales bacterium]|jgi:arginase family enzyme|nr:arginase family protein [Eubacteriales bacterium]MDH7565647.1 arginase family protein [Clostridiales bacterium]